VIYLVAGPFDFTVGDSGWDTGNNNQQIMNVNEDWSQSNKATGSTSLRTRHHLQTRAGFDLQISQL
jgi:hypothetical protein